MTNREQRRAMMRQELDGGDVEVANVDAVDPAPPAPPAPAITLTPEMLQQIVTAAVAAAGSGGGMANAVAEAIRNNRQPIPENTDADYHGRSHYNPEGKDAPRPTLPCEYWLGVWRPDEQKAAPARELEPATLTNDEIRELSQMVAGRYTIQTTDGRKAPMVVQDDQDGFGALRRRIIAFPKEQFDKERRNNLGTLLTFRQRMEPVTA